MPFRITLPDAGNGEYQGVSPSDIEICSCGFGSEPARTCVAGREGVLGFVKAMPLMAGASRGLWSADRNVLGRGLSTDQCQRC